MAKFLVLEDVKVEGLKPDTKQTMAATFSKGTDIEGAIINQDGYTLIADGAYWKFPVSNLFAVDNYEAKLPSNGELPMLSNNPDRPLPIANPNQAEDPIWKHSQMPNYIGAAIGGLVGMKIGDKVQILPGPFNWLLFTAAGLFAGYRGAKYLMEKSKGLTSKA